MCSFKSFFVMKYSQWLNAYSLMPQVVKSPDTYPVQKTLGNAQADNIAKDNMIKIKLKKKKSDLFIETKQTTTFGTCTQGRRVKMPAEPWWEYMKKNRTMRLRDSFLVSGAVGADNRHFPHVGRF